MLNYMLRLTYLAALCKITTKDEKLQQNLKIFEEISQKIEKKINDQKSWFPLRKALKYYTNKTNDLILNLTPENVTQHSRIE